MDTPPIHPATAKRVQARRDLMHAISEYGNARELRARRECSEEVVEQKRGVVKQLIGFLIDAAQQEATAE